MGSGGGKGSGRPTRSPSGPLARPPSTRAPGVPGSGSKAAGLAPGEAARDADEPGPRPRRPAFGARAGAGCRAGLQAREPPGASEWARVPEPQRQPRLGAQGVRRLGSPVRAHTHTPPRGATTGAISTGSGTGDVQRLGSGHAQARPHSQNTLVWGQATRPVLKNPSAAAPPRAQALVGRGTHPELGIGEVNGRRAGVLPQPGAGSRWGGRSRSGFPRLGA